MKGWWRRAVLLLAAGAVLTASPVAAVAAESSLTSRGYRSRALFLDKCSHCHPAERGYDAAADRVEWVRAVAIMALKDRAWIEPADVSHLIEYFQYCRIAQRLLFQRQCGDCHLAGELRVKSKSPSQWRTRIAYMAHRHGGDLSDEELALLRFGLAR